MSAPAEAGSAQRGSGAHGLRSGLGALLAASLAACTSTPTSSVEGIVGPHDVALVGDLLFVTSTDANELRVVDMSQTSPDWVRAPNPLQALSIPVVDRPVELARDVRWDNNGQEIGGSYIYALSENSRDISIVSAASDSLVQKAKWTIPAGLTFTAAAGQGAAEGPSTLFLGTYEGTAARIYRVRVPAPDALGPATNLALEMRVEVRCAVVTSLLVLPDEKLAWSSRPTTRAATDPAGCVPSAPLAGMIDSAGAITTLEFPSPVRRLFTHPAFSDGTTAHPPGERIFGVLDERSCAGGEQCRGILAVDVGPNGSPSKPRSPEEKCGGSPGKIACDFTGSPMLRIFSRGELIMGAAVIVEARLLLPESAIGLLTTHLIGVYTTSNGRMVFFDGQNLRHFDILSGGPTATQFALSAPDGSVLTAEPGPVTGSITLADGAARDEVINFTYLGDLPGFSKIAAPVAASAQIPVTADPTGIVQGADAGTADIAYVEGSNCMGPGTVTTFGPGADGGFIVNVDNPVGGAACTVSIRPRDNAPAPWVVAGTSSGYIGRLSASADSSDPRELPADDLARRRALYFNRPPDLDQANPPPFLKLAFLQPPSVPLLATSRGYRIELGTEDGFEVAEVPMSRVTVAGPPAVRSNDELWVPVFLDSAASNAVLRFQLHSLTPGVEAAGSALQ